MNACCAIFSSNLRLTHSSCGDYKRQNQKRYNSLLREVNQSTHDKNLFKMKSGINTPFPDNDTCNVQKTQICSKV